MVEVLAAGLSGANWALDAPPFTSGDRSPGAGLTVIAIAPILLAPDFPQRLRLQLDRLASFGVHIPGRRAAVAEIELSDALVAKSNALGRLERAPGKPLKRRPSGGHGAANGGAIKSEAPD